MSEQDAKIINHAITRYLARREHSRVELMQKLSAKGFDASMCSRQIQLFTQKNLQSDSRFIESFVRNAYFRGKGPTFIRQTLHQHEVDSVEVSDCIKAENFDWYALALQVRQKKFGEDKAVDFAAKQKEMRFLQYRGFEQTHINEAVN